MNTNVSKLLNTSSAGPVYRRELNLVSNVSADGLAPNGVKPSAVTVLTKFY